MTKAVERLTFEAWMKQVNDLLATQYLGIDSGDLEDWNWSDAFEDGATPKQAIQEFMEEMGYDDQLELWESDDEEDGFYFDDDEEDDDDF